MGGTVKFTDGISCPAIYNDPGVVDVVRTAAAKVVGQENVVQVPQKLSSEDFSHFLTKKPGAIIRIGTRNEEKGCTESAHNSGLKLDEDGFRNGARLFIQYVLEMSEKY